MLTLRNTTTRLLWLARQVSTAALLGVLLLQPPSAFMHANTGAGATDGEVENRASLPATALDAQLDADGSPLPAASAGPAFRPLRQPLPAEQLAASNYGMNVFIFGHPDTTERDLYTLQLAGFGWQKSLFQWRAMEGAGKYLFDWKEAERVVQASNRAGVKILARIDYQPSWTRANDVFNGRPDNLQDFADFLHVFADRFKTGSEHGTVHAIQIWNEPNLVREWGGPISAESAAEYVEMVKLAYQAIKAADPNTLVVTAGLSPTGDWTDAVAPDDMYLEWMFQAGLSGHYDVLGLHGNAHVSDPLAEPGSIQGLEHGSFYFRRVEQLRAIQEAYGDAVKPAWLLEFGWTSDTRNPHYAWFAVSEEQKAENILAAYRYARSAWPWMQVMMLWAMPDPAWDADREEYWWSVADPDGTYRPALERIIDAAQSGQLP